MDLKVFKVIFVVLVATFLAFFFVPRNLLYAFSNLLSSTPEICKGRKESVQIIFEKCCSSFPRYIEVSSDITLIGDSTMKRIFSKLLKSVKNCAKQKEADRCNLIDYLELKKTTKWNVPSAIEGPLGYGKTHPFCTDCSGCKSALHICGRGRIEYISVEFARDVEVQSEMFNTTQDNVAFYLSKRPHTNCVVSAGLHDIAIPALSTKEYVDNVKTFLSMLNDSCKTMIWIQMTGVLQKEKYIKYHNNMRIESWNTQVKNMILDEFSSSYIIDFFNASLSTYNHTDNIHMEPTFYQHIAECIIRIASFEKG